MCSSDLNSTMEMAMPAVTLTFNEGALAGLAGKLPKASGVEVVLYQKMAIGNGSHTANPWLQELPDPITKVTWEQPCLNFQHVLKIM